MISKVKRDEQVHLGVLRKTEVKNEIQILMPFKQA